MSIELNKLRATALAWLGKQEYSLVKFQRKLAQLEATETQMAAVIEEFTNNNWLSEQRYCEGFVRARVRKGQGYIRIRNDGRVQGLDEHTLKQALEDCEADWFDVAKQTYQKRYGERPIDDLKEKAKRLRFMQYRGFTMEQVNYAMEKDF